MLPGLPIECTFRLLIDKESSTWCTTCLQWDTQVWTQPLVPNTFWWPTMQADGPQFMTRCTSCQMATTPRQLLAVLLQPLLMAQHLWSHITVTFMDLTRSQANTIIL